MTDEIHQGGTVLIVEDEKDLADVYAAYLPEKSGVPVVYGGEEAIDVIDDRFDAGLLDRRMPFVSGYEVLGSIEDTEVDCRMAMVAAVNPDFDIIDLRIDDYLGQTSYP